MVHEKHVSLSDLRFEGTLNRSFQCRHQVCSYVTVCTLLVLTTTLGYATHLYLRQPLQQSFHHHMIVFLPWSQTSSKSSPAQQSSQRLHKDESCPMSNNVHFDDFKTSLQSSMTAFMHFDLGTDKS
jgi:hypothetical protein